MSDFLHGLPPLLILIPSLILLVAGLAVLISELAWASSHKDWPRPLASLIGLLVMLAGGAGVTDVALSVWGRG